MTLRFTLLFIAVAAAAPAAQQPVRPDAQPLFTAASEELVVVPVVVTHGDGQFISGLTRDQFSVFDNGRKQTIQLFSSADTPVTLGLVIDDSSSMGPKLGEVLAAALALAQSSNPDDQVFAISFNDRAREVVTNAPLFAHDVKALNAALSQLVPAGRTALYDAVLRALDREVDVPTTARKVIVVISDGGDNASAAGLEQVLRRAREANVTIYSIGLFDDGDTDSNPGVLKKLAVETGGERFLPRSPGPLLRDVEHIAREIRSGYTIAFAPPDHDGQYHRVRVVIDAAGAKHLSIRTRPGYFAPTSATEHPE